MASHEPSFKLLELVLVLLFRACWLDDDDDDEYLLRKGSNTLVGP